jgi:signal transduction histidine kinase
MPPVPADPAGLHQALMNLLNNAVDAVEPDSGVITLRCAFDALLSEAVIVVSDNGPGIEAEVLDQIYQPFYSTKGQRGTGLGLPVTKKIVDEHGGNIDVKSGPGEGTTITIMLSAESKTDPSETAA